MLRFARLLAFASPIVVASLLLVAPIVIGRAGPQQSAAVLALAGLALGTGITGTALVCWLYIGRRFNRMAHALESTFSSDAQVRMRDTGIPGERRLARAFNASVGTFVQIEARATRDRLTGVANRETVLTTLSSEIERATRHHKALSLAFIDIDRFKPINDTYGHNSGDAVLRQIAALINDNVRASDLFGRYGGEEFMLILPETTADEAVLLAEKLRSLVEQYPLAIAGGQYAQVTISIGIAGEVGSQLQLDRLIDEADAAMYAAKSLGRNRTYLFRALDEDAPVRRAPISAERRAAATAIGRWANDTAAEALASVLAPQPDHRGRPSDMIASLATGIALEMGIPHDEIERIRIAALLHDLGKLAVASEILDKPSTLSDIEWQAVGEHPRIGQVILEQASSLREAIPVVLHHHERFNGGGYPHGLKGAEIPIGARIVAVADAYHAMIHERPYSSARGHLDALDELRQHAGSQFDPDVVAVFCQIYAEGVPPDGLQEVYRLHERASGGLARIDPHAQAAILYSGAHAHPTRPARRRANGRDPADVASAPSPIRRAAG